MDEATGERGARAVGYRERRFRSLTPTEERIARLVARGLTNNEIAAELGLGVKTVETHLSKVFRKLRVRSRAELAARPLGRVAPEE